MFFACFGFRKEFAVMVLNIFIWPTFAMMLHVVPLSVGFYIIFIGLMAT
jgi:hypothetical protein